MPWWEPPKDSRNDSTNWRPPWFLSTDNPDLSLLLRKVFGKHSRVDVLFRYWWLNHGSWKTQKSFWSLKYQRRKFERNVRLKFLLAIQILLRKIRENLFRFIDQLDRIHSALVYFESRSHFVNSAKAVKALVDDWMYSFSYRLELFAEESCETVSRWDVSNHRNSFETSGFRNIREFARRFRCSIFVFWVETCIDLVEDDVLERIERLALILCRCSAKDFLAPYVQARRQSLTQTLHNRQIQYEKTADEKQLPMYGFTKWN